MSNLHTFASKDPEADPLLLSFNSNAAAVIMKIGYGYEVSSTSDRYISIAERALSLFASATVPGAHLVDLIPSREFQLSGFRNLTQF